MHTTQSPDDFEHSFAILVAPGTETRFRKYIKPRMIGNGKWTKEVRVMGDVVRHT